MSRILYNTGKWEGVMDNPKYQAIRTKILNSFNRLIFIEEGHKYFLDGVQMTCVSDVTHMFQEHFDSETQAVATSERNWDNPSSKYYHMTPEEILALWKNISNEACSTGTERHEFGESCFYYMTRQYDKILPDFKDRLLEDGGFLAIEPKEEEPDHLTVVIVQKGDQQAGLVVDNLIGQQEIVIKSLGKYINGNKLISGATILGDGDVALILDVNTLM